MRCDLTAWVVTAGLCLIVVGVSQAATTVGSLEPTTGTWRAYRGSSFTTLVCSNSSEAAMLACIAADAERRATSTRYQLRYPNRYATVTYTAPTPTCPPAPAPQTRQQTCPAGTTGTWTQTGTSSVGPAPACAVTVTWSTTYLDGECPPELLPAPTNVIALGIDTRNIRVTWTAVPGASAYVFDRCIGATCTPSFMACVTGTTVNHGAFQSEGLTARYRVRASRDATCSSAVGNLGTYSAIVTGVAMAAPVLGTAALLWTPPTQNTNGTILTNLAGYRVSYGTSPDALPQTIQVANPGVSSYTIGDLTSGTYYFAVRAYTSTGAESANSNVVSKIVQ